MKQKILILVLFALLATRGWASNWLNYNPNYTDGKEFFVTFMNASTAGGAGDLEIALFMAARQATTVYIYESDGQQRLIDSVRITASGVGTSFATWSSKKPGLPAWFLTQDYYCTVSDTVYTKTLHVTSTNDIALYMATTAALSGDASLVLPTNRLGKEYVIQSPTKNGETAEFAVVAVEDGTTITITNTDSANNRQAGIPPGTTFTHTLANKGDVYFLQAYRKVHDLSGTTVCADKDVMVFNGSQNMKTTAENISHAIHVTTPVHMWGKKFALVKTKPQDKNLVKITAVVNNTTVTIHCSNQSHNVTRTLNALDSYEYNWTQPRGDALYIEASEPVVCFQYMQGKGDQSNSSQFDDEGEYIKVAGGAPAVSIITPIEQGIKSAMFSTFQNASNPLTYYVNIVCPTSAVQSMNLDGARITSPAFTTVPGLPGYSYVSKQVSNGAHSLTNNSGAFTAEVYGMTPPTADGWSYYYNLGMDCQHQDYYMLIDGVRTNMASKCKDDNDQWSYDFTAVTNLEYDSIAWYYDNGRMGNDSSFRYTFSRPDTMEHPIYMYVYRHTPICNNIVVDTVVAGVNNSLTYNKIRNVDYYCYGYGDTIKAFEGTDAEIDILADTVPLYTTRTIQHRFTSQAGCDSIVHFKYQVLNPPDVTRPVSICQGSSFPYQGETITEAGMYVFDMLELNTCHYNETIYVTVNPVYDHQFYDTICQNELPYIWRHRGAKNDTIRQVGIHDIDRTLKTVKGCDSVVHLHLVVGQKYNFNQFDTVCDNNLPYSWHGQTIRKSGTYRDNHKTIYGCDSNYTLILKVNPTYLFDTTATFCDNSSFIWRGRIYSLPGVYYDSLLTRHKCDSVFRLTLNSTPSYIIEETNSVCQNSTFTWRSKKINTNNYGVKLYYDSLKTKAGCDSVYKLTLTINRRYVIPVDKSICQGDTYEFAGNTRATWMNNVVGNHKDTARFTTTNGCDSIYCLNLTVNPVFHYDTTGVTCPNAPFRWKQGDLDTSIVKTTPGTEDYYINKNTKAGCDSTYHLLLTVNNTIIVPRTVTISDKDSVIWDHMVYAGTKYHKTTPDSVIQATGTPYTIDHKYPSLATGCDSIMRLIITVCPTYDLEERVTTCQYESYTVEGGHTWTWKKDSVGNHDTICKLETVLGVDSFRHIYLTVYPVYHFRDTDRTCSNTDYVWEGHKHVGTMAADTYLLTDNHKTIHGCDSNYERVLIVMDTIVIPTIKPICDVDTFRWDSTLFAGTKYHGAIAADTILQNGTHNFRRQYKSVVECDSFMTLSITIHPTHEKYDTVVTCQYESYHPNTEDSSWMTLHKDTAGVYDETFRHTTINGCDSVRHMHLTVNKAYSYEESQTTCSNMDFVWEGHERVTIGRQTPGPKTFVDSLKTVNTNCDSVHTLHLMVMDTIVIPTIKPICDVDTFRWDSTLFAGTKYHGAIAADTILQDGTHNFRRQYKSAVGCDSIMTLSITIHPTHEKYDTVQTCQHSPYNPNKEDSRLITLHMDTAGVYDETFRYTTINGCDSIRHMHLTVNKVYSYEESKTTCSNMDFVWEGHERVTIGRQTPGPKTFVDSLKTVNTNCDSVHTLHLMVMDTIVHTKHHAMCDNEAFLWDGNVYAGDKFVGQADSVLTASGNPYYYEHIYTSTLTDCDSIERLVLTVNLTYEFFDTVQTCQYSPYNPNKEDSRLITLHMDTAGVYDETFRLTSVHGCDSVRHMHLTVHPEYTYVDSASTCSNREYHWVGHERVQIGIRRPNTYTIYDSLLTEGYGCDSVHILYLTVMDTIVHTKHHAMCDNEAFLWDGNVYAGDKFVGQADFVLTADGNAYHYEHTYTSVRTKCDSIERLVLTVNPTYLTVLADDSICQGGTYHFSTKFIPCNVPGTYVHFDSLHSIHGCDSIVKITLRVDSTYSFDTRYTICDNVTWTWRGHTFTNVRAGDTVVVDRYRTIHGCDSIYTLYLKSISSYLFEDAYEMCDYDTTTWRSHAYYGLPAAQYVFYDSLKTLTGCDSVYKLKLTIHPHYYIHDTLSMCDNETVYLRQHVLHYPVARTYTIIDSLNSVYKCDSVIETTIAVHPTYLFTDKETICSNQQLPWRGKNYYGASGVFYDSLKSKYGCDSVYKLELTVIPAYLFEDTVTICSNESYYFKGQYLRDDGDHRFKYYTKNGCDSEYVIHLHVLPAYFMNTYETICANEVFNFRGRIVNQQGIYYDSLKTQSGCDSVFVLHLTVRPTYLMSTYDDSHCQGDTVFFRGKTYTQTGVYYDSLKTLAGCDSVFELQLNMKPSYLFVTDTAICDYKTMKWRGYYYSKPGTYYDSLVTRTGCDSVYVLYLQVSPTDYVTIDTTICLGDTYMLGSQPCTTAGVYYDTIRNARDFDCEVTVLNLTTVEPSVFQTITNPDICADDSLVIIPHRLLGEYPNTYSLLFDDAAKAQGFKDIIDEPYNGIIEAPVPECIREEWYVRPDNYEITVQVDNGVCDPKDNEYHGTMLVKYPSWVIEQRWNDVVAALNKFFNGNYEITTYEWFVNGSIVQSGSLSYIYMPGRLSFGDVVYARLTRKGETYSIATCPIVIYDRTNCQTSDFHIIITGTPDPHGALKIVQLFADVDGQFFIADVTGKTLMRGSANANTPMQLELPYPPGVYFLYFYRETGEYKTVKFMLQ